MNHDRAVLYTTLVVVNFSALAVGQNVTVPITSLSAPINILRAFPFHGGGTV